jgi:hypothetical protein
LSFWFILKLIWTMFYMTSSTVSIFECCIPMGTNCAPLLVDFFRIYSYEADFIQGLLHKTFRYIDDVFSLNNCKFGDFVGRHEREKDRIVITKNGTYRWSFAAVVSSQRENWIHILCGNVSFLTGLHYQFRGVGQGMMKT